MFYPALRTDTASGTMEHRSMTVSAPTQMMSPAAEANIFWASFASPTRFMLLRLRRISRIDPTRMNILFAGFIR